jgi:hypothetical protein
MRVYHREDELENHDRGLDYDLPRLLHRRGMLKLVAGVTLASAGLVTLGACATKRRARHPGLPLRHPVAQRALLRVLVARPMVEVLEVERPRDSGPATPQTANYPRRQQGPIPVTARTDRIC